MGVFSILGVVSLERFGSGFEEEKEATSRVLVGVVWCFARSKPQRQLQTHPRCPCFARLEMSLATRSYPVERRDDAVQKYL